MGIPALQRADEPRVARCDTCGRAARQDERVCPLCGERLGESSAWRSSTVQIAAVPGAVAPATARAPRGFAYLGAGALGALVLAYAPIAAFMGWFLGALVHELGHAGVAWLLGMPSIPAIRLDGHAAAVHGEPMLAVALAMWALLLSAPRFLEPRGLRVGAVIAITVLYPALALTSARDVAHLLAGHGAELLFAGVFLWRALTGGFTESGTERALCASLGWYLLGTNLRLSIGLLLSDGARAHYASSGSFGLTNDYLRVAPSFGSLTVVAVLMTVAGLAVLPAVLCAARAARVFRVPAAHRMGSSTDS